MPLYLVSFSLDFSGMMDTANNIYESLGPAFVFPLGITLGIGILGLVFTAVVKVIKGRW